MYTDSYGKSTTSLAGILLNYNFKIEYLTSKSIGHADELSRLISNYTGLLEEKVRAALRDESEFSGLLCNTIKELPVTQEDVKKKQRKRKIS